MPTFNDAKLAALEYQTGLSQSLDDMEQTWLLRLNALSSGHVNDLWYDFLADQGFTRADITLDFWTAGGFNLFTVLNSAGDEYRPSSNIVNSAGTVFLTNPFVRNANGDEWMAA